jgi:hypothetical protein
MEPIPVPLHLWPAIGQQVREEGVPVEAYVESLIEVGIQDAPAHEFRRGCGTRLENVSPALRAQHAAKNEKAGRLGPAS